MWFVCEKEGIAGAASVWTVLISTCIVLNVYILPRVTTLHKFHTIVTNGCIVLSALTHLRVMFTDPGAVPKNAVPLSPSSKMHLSDMSKTKYASADDKRMIATTGAVHRHRTSSGSRIRSRHRSRKRRVCRHCKAFKPPNSFHCMRCQRCVVRIDHHCTWMNNCIAAENLKFFIQFLLYATWGSLHVSLLGLWWLLRTALGFAAQSPADVSPDESGAEAVSVLFDSDQQNTVAVTQTPSRGAIASSFAVTIITMAVGTFLVCIGRVQLRHMTHIATNKHKLKKKRIRLLSPNVSPVTSSPPECTETECRQQNLTSVVFGPDATLIDYLLPITSRRFASEQARMQDLGFSDSAVLHDSADDYCDVEAGDHLFTEDEEEDDANWNMEVPPSAQALDIVQWLEEIGFARFTEVFASNAITGDVLPFLTLSQLREMEEQVDPMKRISDSEIASSHKLFMQKKQEWVNSFS